MGSAESMTMAASDSVLSEALPLLSTMPTERTESMAAALTTLAPMSTMSVYVQMAVRIRAWLSHFLRRPKGRSSVRTA